MALSKIAPIQPPQVDLGTAMVTIIVGDDRENFNVHNRLLFATAPVFKDYYTKGHSDLLSACTDHSATIRRATNSKWVDSGILVLPQEDSLLFRFFRDWLYSGCIPNTVTCYTKAGSQCSEDEFWWRVLQLGKRFKIERLIALAAKELTSLFSENEPTIPSRAFVQSVFDEPSSDLDCWKEYLVHHAAFWLEQSADRAIWFSLLESHSSVGPALARAVVRKWHVHPQHVFPQWGCPSSCSLVLAGNYQSAATKEAQQSQDDRVLGLVGARLMTNDQTEPTQSEADGDYADGWGCGSEHEPTDQDGCYEESDALSCTEGLAVATPSQSTIRERPTEAAPPVPSLQAPSPLPISAEHDEHVNTKQPQDLFKEIGGSNYADLVAKFSAWLLTEASGQNGTKGQHNRQTGSTSNHGENIAGVAHTSTTNDLNSHTEPAFARAANSGWETHGGLDTPSYRYCIYCGYCPVDPISKECNSCGYGLAHTGNLGWTSPPQAMWQHQHNETGGDSAGSVDTRLADWGKTGGIRKVRETGGW